MKLILVISLISLSLFSTAQQKKTQILLIGTFHFNNPGHDAKKEADFDILSDQAQKDLEFLSNKIRDFHPTKFYVEWEYKEQNQLDSLYKLYLAGKYFAGLDKNKRGYRYYSQCEIFQLAFRASASAHLKKVEGVDCPDFLFPYDSLMSAVKAAHQTDLLQWADSDSKAPGTASDLSPNLVEKLLGLNTEEERRSNRSWYFNFANRGGNDTTFIGPYLVSEWFKRNLYMYSLVQKYTRPDDQRVVILLGAGHISMLEKFIRDDDRFEIVELKDIINRP